MKRKILAALAAITALTAIGGVAQAQPYGPPGYGQPGMERPGGWDVDRKIQWTQDRIARARDDGSLGRREFRRVQGELNNIRHEEDAFRRNHGGNLPDHVRVDLEARLDQLNDQIHWAREHDEHRPW